MTVGMDKLNAMFRDFKVAQDVGKMMEMRYFEQEFELFGTVFLDGGQRNYLVSKDSDTIYRQITELSQKGYHPLPCLKWNGRALVPSGWEEEIEQRMKENACREWQATYSLEFLQHISDVSEGYSNDAGAELLEQLKNRIEWAFDSDQNQLFQGVLDILYDRKNISHYAWKEYRAWVHEAEEALIDDLIVQDIFGKNLYGIASKEGDKPIKVVINASEQSIRERKVKLEQNPGTIVTPIFSKKCWYNYDYRLEQARDDFKEKLARLYDEDYFSILQQIRELPVAVNAAEYQKAKEQLEASEQQAQLQIWNQFGKIWGIE